MGDKVDISSIMAAFCDINKITSCGFRCWREAWPPWRSHYPFVNHGHTGGSMAGRSAIFGLKMFLQIFPGALSIFVGFCLNLAFRFRHVHGQCNVLKKNKHQVARCRVVLGQSKKRPLVVENNLLHLRVVWYRGRFGEVGLDHRVGLKKNKKVRSLWVLLVSFQFDLNIHFF